MGHMVAGLMVSTSWMERTKSEMAGPRILRIGGVIDTCTITVLVLTGIMIILTRGATRDIFWMSLRKKIHLHWMER